MPDMTPDELAQQRQKRLEWFTEAMDSDSDFTSQCLREADELVDGFVGTGNPWGVPEHVLERARLEVAADLYYRKQARNGVVGLDSIEAQPFRISRDPMASAYPLLRRFIPTGLA